MNLTINEIEILIDSVKVWQTKEISSSLTAAMLHTMLSKTNEEAEKYSADALGKGKEKAAAKEEVATCLRAKLILMKEELKTNADIMTASAAKEETC